MRLSFVLAVGIYILFSVPLGAQASDSCHIVINSFQDVMVCAESRAPEVLSSVLEVDRSKAMIDAASEWRNPELSVQDFRGPVGGQLQSETDFFLGVPIELGGKVQARKSVARGGLELAEAKLYEARAQVRILILTKLHRLRQVYHEQEIENEAISTFSKLIEQYERRPNLSPEQQTSLLVYELSRSEYELKRSNTLDEILSLESFFKAKLGLTLDQIRPVIPKNLKVWPDIVSHAVIGTSPKQKALKAELEIAHAELSRARSDAWPTLTLGPSFRMQRQNGQMSQLTGLNLSFPLPIFNLNGGAKAVAAADVRLNESRREIGRLEEDMRREELRKKYTQAVRTIKESLSHDDIENRHRQADRLFSKGMVPSSLVIETHRTLFELEKTRHERELQALESLLEIHTIDGTILEAYL